MNDYKFGEYIFKLTDDENYKNASLAKDAFPYDTQGFIVLHNLTKESFIWNPLLFPSNLGNVELTVAGLLQPTPTSTGRES